jgi:AGZA family xanthine/uracil permease-like MFS transporter
MRALLERRFALAAAGSSVRTEVLAGATTFLTMAYIIVVNPAILHETGMPLAGVAAATCIAAAVGSLLMGLIANYPIALAPGMGLNAYFAYTVVKGMGVPWETALGCVFISGVAFLLMTAVGLRQLIVGAIPRPLFAAVAAGVGLFITFIGLKDAGVVVSNPATTVGLGDLKAPATALALLGVLIIGALQALRVRAAILIGVAVITALAWALGLVALPAAAWSRPDLTGTMLKLDVPGALHIGGPFGAGLLEIVFVFLFVDLFDNLGTLVAVTKEAGLVRADGTIPRLNRILLADSLAAIVGALAGTSTTVSYIESAAGVAAGGRTGLASVVTGLLFLAALAFTPLAPAIPAAATAPALILVGGMMLPILREIDWSDPVIGVPALLTVATIPLTFSIANGLAIGIVSYAALKLITGRWRRSDAAVSILALLCAARFLYLSAK